MKYRSANFGSSTYSQKIHFDRYSVKRIPIRAHIQRQFSAHVSPPQCGTLFRRNNRTEAASYARLSKQVSTHWHSRNTVDAYYFDGAAFICKKLDSFGNFEILDVFSVEVSENEFNDRRERAAKRLANEKAWDYRRFSRELRNELGRDNDGASRAENGGTANETGTGARRLGGSEETTTDSRRGDDGGIVYSQNGEVFAYRVGDNGDIRFSAREENSHGDTEAQREAAEIIRKAKENGTWMKAPNGKPTKLSEKQWVQVRTKAFIFPRKKKSAMPKNDIADI